MKVYKAVHTAFGQVNMHGPKAGNAAHEGINCGLNQRGADGRINDIAALAQDT